MKIKDFDLEARNSIIKGVSQGFPRTKKYKDTLNKVRVEKPTYKKDGSLSKKKAVWFRCNHCKELFKQIDIQVDHISPVVPITISRLEMLLCTYIERMYFILDCQVLCKKCHTKKSTLENAQRRLNKKKHPLLNL